MAAKDALITPLVAQGLALLTELDTAKARREIKAAELAPFDAAVKDVSAKLETVKEQLIELGPGLYADPEGHTCRVAAGIDAALAPDTFHLAETEEANARKLAGDHFLKLFTRKVVHECKAGFDAIADALLTPAKARALVALCIVPGQLCGGRKPALRWK